MSTPSKRPTVGSGFMISHPKALILADEQMDIEDEDDDPNEILNDDLRLNYI